MKYEQFLPCILVRIGTIHILRKHLYIHIECSKQFKWNLYFYVSGQSGPFWAVLKLLGITLGIPWHHESTLLLKKIILLSFSLISYQKIKYISNSRKMDSHWANTTHMIDMWAVAPFRGLVLFLPQVPMTNVFLFLTGLFTMIHYLQKLLTKVSKL